MSHLNELKALAMKCTRCGSCLEVCPVHRQVLEESSSPRGKLFLLRSLAEDKVNAGKILEELAGRCTLCMACVQRCPSGVKTTELILSLRKEMAEGGHLSLAKKVAFAGLTYQKIFDLAMGCGPFIQNIFFKAMADGHGKIARFPIPAAGLNKRRVIPSFPQKTFSQLIKKENTVAGSKARVAFFPGCMLRYMYTDVAKSLVDVLNHNKIDVIVPDGLSCCGIPSFASGDFVDAAEVAKKNITALAQGSYDAIITGCGTCGAALSSDYGAVLEEGNLKEQWKELSLKVYDFTDYLVKKGYSTDFKPLALTCTYHDSCHLNRTMGVAKQPRELIHSIPQLNLVEMKDASTCCGCAGSFSATHYDLSRKINDVKLDNALQTGADIIVAGCSACRMHLIDGLAQRNIPIEVLHTAQLLARAYGL